MGGFIVKSLKSKLATSLLISGMVLPAISPVVTSMAATPVAATTQSATAKPTSTRGYVVENTTTVDLSKASSAAYKVALPDGFTFNLSMSKDGVSAQGSIFDATGSNFNDNQILLGDANYLQANTTMQYFVKVGSTWHLRALKFVNNKATAGVKDFYFDTTTLDQSALADKYDAIKQTIAPGVDVKINATASKDIVEMATIQYMITAEGTNVPDFNYEGVNEHQGYVTSPAYSNTKETTFTFSYFNEQGQMMTAVLHFQKNDVKPVAQPVTVNYVDANGQKLADSDTLKGNVGASYQTAAKTIAGYHVVTTPANAKGTFTDKAQTVTYTYEKDTVTTPAAKAVTVNYVDANGQKLAASETLNGKVGAAYQTTAKTIAGYHVAQTPANANGSFTDKAQTVTYTYEKDAVTTPAAKAVTVKYVDANGKEIAKADVLTGQLNAAYQTAAKTIAGYKLVKTPANAKGQYTASAQTVVYEYQKEATTPVPDTRVKITAIYVDQQGHELTTALTKVGHKGDRYKATAPTIKGYELVAMPKNASGVLDKDDVTIKFVYRKVTTNHQTPSKDQTANPNQTPTDHHQTTTPDHHSKGQVTTTKQQPAKKAKKQLPQTSSTTTIAASVMGIALVALAGVLGFYKKLRKTN